MIPSIPEGKAIPGSTLRSPLLASGAALLKSGLGTSVGWRRLAWHLLVFFRVRPPVPGAPTMKNTKRSRRQNPSPRPPLRSGERAGGRGSRKQPFDIERAIPLLREAVRPYPRAALFELAAEGYRSVFEQLVACIISIRTLDEVTLPAARRLFASAGTPAQLASLTPEEIDERIGTCTYHEPESRTIHEIALRTVKEFAGELPCDARVLQTFHGVGPKCTTWRRASLAVRP